MIRERESTSVTVSALLSRDSRIPSIPRATAFLRRVARIRLLHWRPSSRQSGSSRRALERRFFNVAVRRDLGEILSHGEPDRGMGQGDGAEQPAEQSPGQAFWDGEVSAQELEPGESASGGADGAAPAEAGSRGDGVVVVDFRGLGPDAA